MKLCMSKQVATAAFLLLIALSAFADSAYQSPEEFIAETFADNVPATQILWVTAELRSEARAILGHELAGLRIRYWQVGPRSAWILDEIGKDKPITTGVVINDDAIETIKVLVFRESRGWEVRYPFFTDQFIGVRAKQNNQLDRNIDGISGATLSVSALRRQAQLALLLTRYTKTTDIKGAGSP
jgi:hypothetical protein